VRLSLTLLFVLAVSACSAQPPAAKPPIVQAVVRAAGLQGRIMWIDGTANLDNLNTREKMADVMERCRRAGINIVVMDVKPLIGETMYPSKVARQITKYDGKDYDPEYDYLAVALQEGRKRGLEVYAAINVFSEGHKLVGRGLAYDKPEWQAITYNADRTVVTPEGAYPVASSINTLPPAGGMSVYTSDAGSAKTPRPNETYSVIVRDSVQATFPAAGLENGPVPIPAGGCLLVGDGAAGDWMADKLRPGVRVRWEAGVRFANMVQTPAERVSVFINPILREPLEHELAVIREIARNYDIDGIVFDRMRYANLTTDFSNASRTAFEQWSGKILNDWPHDIMRYSPRPNAEVMRGPQFERWLEWRSRNVRRFAEDATRTVRDTRSKAKCAVYVGSWYPVYYSVGVNWAGDEYHAGYDWMTETYHETGYAPLFDWICSGTYYPDPWRADAVQAGRDPEATVEARGELSNTVIDDSTYVYGSVAISDYVGRPAAFKKAVEACTQVTQGVMFFDLSHVIKNSMWPYVDQLFAEPAIPPHSVAELLDRVKNVRKVLPARKAAPPPDENWRLVVPE